MDLETALAQGGWDGSEPIVLANTLEGPYGPKIIPYGKRASVTTIDHSPLDEKDDPYNIVRPHYQEYEELEQQILSDFGENDELGIMMGLNEGIMNFASYRNGYNKGSRPWLVNFPWEAETIGKVRIWPWRSIAHLCFAINADGPPDYDFDPSKVRTTMKEADGSVHFTPGGRGHFIMMNFANLVFYDGERGLYLYFNLPEKHWITD